MLRLTIRRLLATVPILIGVSIVTFLLMRLVPGDFTLTLLGPEHFVARPALWLRALSRYRATVSPAPNFAYALCASRIAASEMEGVDLSSWVTAFDDFPLDSVVQKATLFKQAVDEDWLIVLSHEREHPIGRLVPDRDRYRFEPI